MRWSRPGCAVPARACSCTARACSSSRSTARLAPTRGCGRPSASRRGRRTSPPASPPPARSRRWLRDLAGDADYDALYAEAAAAGPGAGGLLALPYFAGERTPLFDPDLRGAIVGLTAAHGRGHLFRAFMEAAAFAVRQNLETMREAGATVAALRSSGGGAGGALWPRIVSDVTGVGQEVREGPSRAGVGAALLAAICAGAATLETTWPQPAVSVGPGSRHGGAVRPAVRVVPRARDRHASAFPRACPLAAGPRAWHDVACSRPGRARARRT